MVLKLKKQYKNIVETNNLVSFEDALLLKYAGFNEECEFYYYHLYSRDDLHSVAKFSPTIFMDKTIVCRNSGRGFNNSNYIAAPTRQQYNDFIDLMRKGEVMKMYNF
jgi:hypothetical protein